MSSASSADRLTAYLTGQLTAEQLVAAVTAEFYQNGRNGKRETWRPILDVVERAHPGVVELTASEQQPGFDVRLAERPFPKRYEAELRRAVETVLQTLPASGVPFPAEVGRKPGFLDRIVAAVRRLFNA